VTERVPAKSTLPPFATFEDFWPYYLRQHADARTRAFHFVGTTVAFWVLVGAALSGRPSLVFAAVLAAYVFAWAGHALVERNRPATFGNPLWSLRGDIRMYWLWLEGRLARELARSGVR
jgi:hypothetical protein